MAGGLLEKAKQKTDEGEGMFSAVGDADKPDLKKEKDDSTSSEKASPFDGGLLAKGAEKQAASSKPLMLYAAVTTMVVAMVLLYMLGSLPAFSGLGVLALIALSGSFALGHVASINAGSTIRPTQWATIIVIYILLSAVPYSAGMEWSGSTAITGIEFIDDGMNITVTFRQTGGLLGDTFDGGNVEVWVIHGEVETYRASHEATMGNTEYGAIGTVKVSVADIYDDNAFVIIGKEVAGDGSGDWLPDFLETSYHIYVSAGGSDGGAASLSSIDMSRTINDVDAIAAPIYSQDDSECDGSKSSCVVGMVLESWLGIGNTDEDAYLHPSQIAGWYTIDATFYYVDGDQEMITFPTITVTETVASWTSIDAEFGDGVGSVGEYNSYLLLEGSTSEGDTLDRLHFPRVDVFDDYGCYSLTVSATNDPLWGGEPVGETTFFEWNEIIADDGNGHYESEEFKQVSSC